jgi:hypothetical protein
MTERGFLRIDGIKGKTCYCAVELKFNPSEAFYLFLKRLCGCPSLSRVSLEFESLATHPDIANVINGALWATEKVHRLVLCKSVDPVNTLLFLFDSKSAVSFSRPFTATVQASVLVCWLYTKLSKVFGDDFKVPRIKVIQVCRLL